MDDKRIIIVDDHDGLPYNAFVEMAEKGVLSETCEWRPPGEEGTGTEGMTLFATVLKARW